MPRITQRKSAITRESEEVADDDIDRKPPTSDFGRRRGVHRHLPSPHGRVASEQASCIKIGAAPLEAGIDTDREPPVSVRQIDLLNPGEQHGDETLGCP